MGGWTYPVESAHRFTQIPVVLGVVEVEVGGGIVGEDPGEDRVLGEVVERAAGLFGKVGGWVGG